MQSQRQTDQSFTSSSTGKAIVIVGSYPIGIGINQITNKIYVANQFSNTVSVIDSSTDIIESTIPVENFPYDLEVNPFNNRIYVTNRGSNTVSVIDGSTNQKLSNIEVGGSPVGISINPSKNIIYVTNLESKSLSVIDGINNKVIKTLKLNSIPYGIEDNPTTNQIYISNIDNATISVIDGKTNRIVHNTTVESYPTGIGINHKTGTIYVANYVSNTVSVINGTTNTVESTIKVGDSPVDVAVNSIDNKVYVTNNGDNTVSVIDGVTNKKIRDISLPTAEGNYDTNDPILNIPIEVDFPLIASRISINHDTDLIYVTNTASNGMSVIDGKTDSVVVRLFIDVNPDNSGMVECSGSNNIYKLQAGSSILYPKNIDIKCTANPAREYSFDFWSNMISNDKSNMLSSNKNPLVLNVTKNNVLVANFKDSISTEAYIGMVAGIVGSASIFAGIYKRRGERKYLNRLMSRIDFTYNVLKENKPEGVKQLEEIRKEMINLFKRGKITDAHYNILDKRITELVNTFFRNESK